MGQVSTSDVDIGELEKLLESNHIYQFVYFVVIRYVYIMLSFRLVWYKAVKREMI